MVTSGVADIAAIDCVSLAGFRLHEPELTRGIHVIGYSAPYPGLPLITSGMTSVATLGALREALTLASTDVVQSSLLQELFITGFSALEIGDYKACLDMRDEAFAVGCCEL